MSDASGSFEAESLDKQIDSWRDEIRRDLDRSHDDLCEQELIVGPLVYSPCGCDERAQADGSSQAGEPHV